jgi:hypothetical protein
MALRRKSVTCRYTWTVAWAIEAKQGHSGTLWVELLERTALADILSSAGLLLHIG